MGRKWWESLIGSKKSETSEETAEERIRYAAETHAEDLDLSGLGLPELPESLGHLTALRMLSLSGNQLSALAESLGRLTALQALRFSGNQLTALPESLGRLTALQMLDLDGNELSALPEWLGQLTALQTLSFSGNQLTGLPESLGQLTSLQTLYLDGNQLSALPESLGRLDELRELYLHNNRQLGLPAEVLGPTWQEVLLKKKTPAPPKSILDYYFRSRQARPLNEAKLILIGRGAVGKSSLVDCLVHKKPFDPSKKKTEGIQITAWPLKLNGEEVRLHVWDFGGQEIMHATHQFFLTERSLYLLVLERPRGWGGRGRRLLAATDRELRRQLTGDRGAEQDQGTPLRSQPARPGAEIRRHPRVRAHRLRGRHRDRETAPRHRARD